METESPTRSNRLRFGVLVASIVATLAIMVLAMTTMPASALAESGSTPPTPPATGAQEQAQEDLPSYAGGLPLMGNDYVWFGKDFELGQGNVKNDIIVAAQTVNLTGCTAGGSIRLAAQDLAITNSTAAENITVAAQNIRIENTNANAIAAAAQNVFVSGSCKELTVYASKVIIDGTVDGNVVIGAGEVEVRANAHITGTLHVSAPKEPVVQSGAKIGEVKFTKEDSSEQVAEAGAGLALMASLIGIVVRILGSALVALLSEWLFRRHTLAASKMAKERTAATIGTGMVGAIVVPIAIIILFILVITIPVALFLLCATIALAVISCGFAGASLFRLAFPKLGRFVCALAGGAVLGVASVVPILGGIVRLTAFVFTIGYALQAVYLGLRDNSSDTTVTAS